MPSNQKTTQDIGYTTIIVKYLQVLRDTKPPFSPLLLDPTYLAGYQAARSEALRLAFEMLKTPEIIARLQDESQPEA
jgi:hypothetical protein